jgi:hypothetical protein
MARPGGHGAFAAGMHLWGWTGARGEQGRRRERKRDRYDS